MVCSSTEATAITKHAPHLCLAASPLVRSVHVCCRGTPKELYTDPKYSYQVYKQVQRVAQRSGCPSDSKCSKCDDVRCTLGACSGQFRVVTPWHIHMYMQGAQYYYKPLNAKTPYYWIVVRSCHCAQQSCTAQLSNLVCSV